MFLQRSSRLVFSAVRGLNALPVSRIPHSRSFDRTTTLFRCVHLDTTNLSIWNECDAVCFDVDSTVCTEEGIDVLATYCGSGDAVREWTSKAMDGNVKFEDALAARLDIIQPTVEDIQNCLREHPPQLSNGIVQLVQSLHSTGKHVYLVSGGFRLMIEPVAQMLGIPQDRIYANSILFDSDNNYKGFDANEPTSKDGGKPAVVKMLKERHAYKSVVMVGDGATDLQAKPPADLFIGYGGVVQREVVKSGADVFITDFAELNNNL